MVLHWDGFRHVSIGKPDMPAPHVVKLVRIGCRTANTDDGIALLDVVRVNVELDIMLIRTQANIGNKIQLVLPHHLSRGNGVSRVPC